MKTEENVEPAAKEEKNAEPAKIEEPVKTEEDSNLEQGKGEGKFDGL